MSGFGSAIAVSASSKTFFRPFEAQSRISAPFDNEPPGLEVDSGWPLLASFTNLIGLDNPDKPPHGWILLLVHFSSFLFYYVWEKSVKSTAKEVLAKDGADFMANDEKYLNTSKRHPPQSSPSYPVQEKTKGNLNGLSESQQRLTADVPPNEIGAGTGSSNRDIKL
jgi:hypothetical protein